KPTVSALPLCGPITTATATPRFAASSLVPARSPVTVPMSAFGTKRTFRGRVPMSAFGGKADIAPTQLLGHAPQVALTVSSGQRQRIEPKRLTFLRRRFPLLPVRISAPTQISVALSRRKQGFESPRERQ